MAGTNGGKEKKIARASAYLVNNQGQCAGGRNGGRLGAFLVCSHVRSSTVTDGDGDEGGKKR